MVIMVVFNTIFQERTVSAIIRFVEMAQRRRELKRPLNERQVPDQMENTVPDGMHENRIGA